MLLGVFFFNLILRFLCWLNCCLDQGVGQCKVADTRFRRMEGTGSSRQMKWSEAENAICRLR
jgi:hypothetical protein